MYLAPTGRKFYHNPLTGETSWKPPRKFAGKKKRNISGGKIPYLPRSANSVYAFGCEKAVGDEYFDETALDDQRTKYSSPSASEDEGCDPLVRTYGNQEVNIGQASSLSNSIR